MIGTPLAQASNLNVWALVLGAGLLAKFVLLVLAVFSIASWSIMAERQRRFRRAERESRRFLDRFQRGGGLAAIHDETAQLRFSPLASIYRAGFREISLNPPPADSAGLSAAVEAVDRVLRKHASVQMTALERSLGFLATTASATPFIGLFGTVWGIMRAFHGIGISGTASLAAYAPGIAEALVATAAGLGAAIPAVIGYNHFLGRLRGMDALVEEFIADFIHRIQGRRS
ncbi:MAG TPA: MotA/TolQ/ExbB proton channel family protein [Candidatus Polarisedimenticolaceae bacterium]|nr:MotA/TolQ/ExbB proton channel family protein [Candidatus Polarisedimenticolaceae bacterium]